MWKLLCFLNTDPAFSRPPWTRRLSKCATLANLYLQLAPSVLLHVRVHVICKKTCTRRWFPKPDVLTQCHCDCCVCARKRKERERRKRKGKGDLLDSACWCRGLTGFYHFLWLNRFSFSNIQRFLLDASPRTRVQSSNSEEKTPFSQLPGQMLGHVFNTAFIFEKRVAKLWSIIWVIADDH